MTSDQVCAELHPIYVAECKSGQTTLSWHSWLNEVAAYRPRLSKMALSVRYALRALRG